MPLWTPSRLIDLAQRIFEGANFDWFGEVKIESGFACPFNVCGGTEAAQCDTLTIGPQLSQFRNEIVAIAIWKSEIRKDKVVGEILRKIPCFHQIFSRRHFVSPVLQ